MNKRALPFALLIGLISTCAAVASMPDFGKDQYSVSVWIKTAQDGPIFGKMLPKGKWVAGGKTLFISDGHIMMDIGWVGNVKGRKMVTDNKWHHVVLVGPAPQKIYVDGKLDATGNLKLQADPAGSIFKIGIVSSNFPLGGRGLRGDVDDVRVYGQVLSPEGIAALACNKSITAKPVAHWPLDGKTDDVVGKNRAYIPSKRSFEKGKYKSSLRLAAPKLAAAKRRKRPSPGAPPLDLPAKFNSEAANRLIARGIEKIVFVKRYTYQSSHYYTDFIDGCKYYGGNICTLDLKSGQERDLAPGMAKGIFGRFDVSYDAKKVIFDWKADVNTGFNIYEVNVDGTGLRQITRPPANEDELKKKYITHKGRNWCRWAAPYDSHRSATEDMHPCYLPDGNIMFISTRCHYGILCDGPDRLFTTVLYKMDANGKNMQKMTNSAVSEASPTVMDDGRILYTRWEYVDKGAVSVKCLWAMRPDGTATVEVAGQEIRFPDTFLHARQIPGRPNLIVFVGAPHCPQTGIGPIIVVDTNKNIRSRESLTYITPDVDIRGEGGFAYQENGRWRNDNTGAGTRLFIDPYPISDKLFLVSMKPKGPVWYTRDAWGLNVLNEKGEAELLYRAKGISAWQPYPLRPRKRPPVIPVVREKRLAAKRLARVAVIDIYRGMTGVERGTIKWIRINEQIPRPWRARRRWRGDGAYQQHAVISRGAHHAPKAQWGIVPVEQDGSAHFLVPADRNIFLQALDENYMEVQRQRTYVNYRPGEVRTCIGCHEPYGTAPPAPVTALMAMKRPPSQPGPQPGEKTGRRPLYYPMDVQPILDKHCIKCHGDKDPKSGLKLVGTPTKLFSVSYEQLTQGNLGQVHKKYLSYVGENYPKTGNIVSVPPKTLGSHNSLLVAILSKGKVQLADPKQNQRAQELAEKHKKLNLSQAELIRITTWVDTNGQFYGAYWGRRNIQYKDHPNYRPVFTFEQCISTYPPVSEDKR